MSRRLLCSLSLAAALVGFSAEVNAATPFNCTAAGIAQSPDNTDPCTWIRTGRLPVLTPYPFELMICIDYRKLTGLRGSVGMFALKDFDPTNEATIQEQLERAVFKDHRTTDASGVWCRGRHWFKEARWVVFCDEFGGIGWVSGDSFEYARRNTWLPERRPVVMGIIGPMPLVSWEVFKNRDANKGQ